MKVVATGDGAPARRAEFAPPAYELKAGGSPAAARYQAGYAQHLRDALPNATFVAFTGTPVSSEDRDTRAVFGDYIHVYDMQQAKEDGATVAIYYESRLAKLGLKQDELPPSTTRWTNWPKTKKRASKPSSRAAGPRWKRWWAPSRASPRWRPTWCAL
jgi:hypothetical protein